MPVPPPEGSLKAHKESGPSCLKPLRHGWTAHLNSTYRGLSADRKGIEVRPLTVILGPNNGGKSQFLRSMVLLAACKRLLSPDERGYPLPLRGSLAQNLADMGFQDLAEELPEI